MLLGIISSVIAIYFHIIISKKYDYSVIFHRSRDSYSLHWWLYFLVCIAIFVHIISKDGNISCYSMAISSIIADIAMMLSSKIKK